MRTLRAVGGVIIGLAMLVSTVAAQTLSMERDDHPSTIAARGIATADFNRDGWTDIVTAHNDPDGVTVLLNRGSAHGYNLAFIPLPGGPFDLVTGDLNKDGAPDIAVANPDANLINVLFGRGDGTFRTPLNVGARFNPRSLAIADVDLDGLPDIVFTEYFNRSVTIYYGDGAGDFLGRQPGSIGPVGDNPQGVAVADFNLDGWPDLVVAGSTTGGLTMVLQTPNNHTFALRSLNVPPQQSVVTVGDFDRDGRPDVAATAPGSSDVTIVLNGRTAMTTHVYPVGGSSARGIVAVDLDRDGALDIVTANRGTSTLQVLAGNGDGTFASATGLAAGTGSRAVAAADFDNDGRIDLASGNEYAATMTVLSNTTAFPRAAFAFHRDQLGASDRGFSGPVTIDVADFDNDGKMDAVTDNFGLLVLFGNGRSTQLANEASSVAAVRLNKDGYADVITLQQGFEPSNPTRIEAFLGDAAGLFQARRTTATSLVAFSMVTADFNRDGLDDVALAGRTEIQVLVGTGDGRFTLASSLTMPATFTDPSAGDLDRDGDLDLVAYVNGATSVLVWLNDGTGHFGAARTTRVDGLNAIYGGSLGDVNHDGYLDYAVAGNPRVYPSGQRVALLLGGPSGFQAPTYLASNETILTTAVADVTLDGNPDIVGDTGVIFTGRGDGTFAEPELFDWYAPDIHVIDFNRDGLPDVVAPYADGTVEILVNERRDTNTAPTVDLGPDVTSEYRSQFGDGERELWARGEDAEMHKLTFRWRYPDGTEVDTGTFPSLGLPILNPGRHEFVVEASDGRGGTATDSVVITITPAKEVVLHVGEMWSAWTEGQWQRVNDPTAASGMALHDVNAGAAKVTTPLANPASYADVGFAADPTQTYKLWVRLKADGNHFANDSLWLQFSDAVDAGGRTFAPGSTSGIEVVLEECSGCGESGWGWRDEAWGQRDTIGSLTLRFPTGGWQTLRLQSREDGVSIDQVVLSSETYRTTRPGTVKNDNTILPRTFY